MEYIAHRGMWIKDEERNTLPAFLKGLDAGFGVEVDIRDMGGQLVISHDVPQPSNPPPKLSELFSYYLEHQHTATVALNIKADGLQNLLLTELNKFDIKNYFVFDMSAPDTLAYIAKEIRVFKRSSDCESYNFGLLSVGIWLDELVTNWVNPQNLVRELDLADKICLVSRELHRRDKTEQWNWLKDVLSIKGVSDKLMLCTDFPEEAKRFFE